MAEAPQSRMLRKRVVRPSFEEVDLTLNDAQEAAQPAEPVKAKRVKMVIHNNTGVFAQVADLMADLEQKYGDTDKQLVQMRQNNNDLQDEMKKAKEAWVKERRELAEASAREKGNLKASNRRLIAAVTSPDASAFATMAVQAST